MVLIRAIVRPEMINDVSKELLKAGYTSITKMDVYGRGKQKGIKIGNVFYDELAKEMLLMIVEDSEKEAVIQIIMKTARTGEKGNPGDGRIFVTPVDEAYTISSQSKGL